jgi:hypothetical protein
MANGGDRVLHPPPPPPPPPPPTSKYIEVLNGERSTFIQSESNDLFWVVKFFRENCPRCERLRPDYVWDINDSNKVI